MGRDLVVELVLSDLNDDVAADASNPFPQPKMARTLAGTTQPSPPRSMAARYMGWALFATVISLLIGLRTYKIARRARAASTAGDVAGAIELSHRSKRLSVKIVAVVVIVIAVAVLIFVTGQSGSG